MTEESKKAWMEQAIEEIKKVEGYRILKHKEHEWCYVITPRDNVLYVGVGYFQDFEGFDVSFRYIPSKENGSGCACNEPSKDPIFHFDKETLEKAENYGINFATQLKANRYASSEAYLSTLRDRDKYMEL